MKREFFSPSDFWTGSATIASMLLRDGACEVTFVFDEEDLEDRLQKSRIAVFENVQELHVLGDAISLESNGDCVYVVKKSGTFKTCEFRWSPSQRPSFSITYSQVYWKNGLLPL